MDCEFDDQLYKKVQRKSSEKLIPLNALFELTYKCNLSCCHCYIIDEGNEELSTAEIKNTLDQLAEAGTLFLTLSGGEIFTRDDFFDIAAYAREKSFSLRLFTNGTLITAEIANKIKELYPIAVEISLYGATKDTHENITGSTGSYHKTIQALKLLQKRGVRTVMKTNWMKLNCQEIPQWVNLAKNLGTLYKSTAMISVKNNGSRASLSQRLSGNEFFQMSSTLYKLHPTALKAELEELRNRTDVETKTRLPAVPCEAGTTSCAISPYGDVYPCIQILERAGNLRQKKFGEIWTHAESLKKLRKIRSLPVPQCSSCDLSTYCFRCPGMAWQEEGSLLKPPLESCRQAKIRKEVIKNYEQQKEEATV